MSAHDDGSGGSGSGGVPLLRPKPQRHWQITPLSTEPSTPRSPSTEPPNDKDAKVPRSRSLLNLTASTLFGIYAPQAGEGSFRSDEISQPPTPARPGNMTPLTPLTPRGSIDDHKLPVIGLYEAARLRQPPTVLLRRQRWSMETLVFQLRAAAMLVSLGLAYGTLLVRLQDRLDLVQFGIAEKFPRAHLFFWAAVALCAGLGLPALDRRSAVSATPAATPRRSGSEGRMRRLPVVAEAGVNSYEDPNASGMKWTNVVRGAGAFIGIAFAIRRLPWDVALRAALTLALSNPLLWYMLDGTTAGLMLATVVAAMGAGLTLGGMDVAITVRSSLAAGSSNSDTVANATQLRVPLAGASAALRPESVAVATYAASTLFYACICFGALGRRLTQR